MKKPQLIESVRSVVATAEAKIGLTADETRHIIRLKNWLREQEEAASVGSRGWAHGGRGNDLAGGKVSA